MPYKIARVETLVFIIDKDDEVLLGLKNPKKFGGDKWNGFGGGVEPNNTIEETAIIEVKQECGLIGKKEDLKKVGEIEFVFLPKPEWNKKVHIFLLKEYKGRLRKSNEMGVFNWFSKNNLPLEYMWPGDRLWVPAILCLNLSVKGIITLGDKKGNVVGFNLHTM